MMPENDEDIAPSIKNIEKSFDLDDILTYELGQFGRFQIRSIILIAIPLTMSAFMSEYVFSAAPVRHRCMVPECGEENKGLTYEQSWLSRAVPMVDDIPVSCERFAPSGNSSNRDICPATLFNQQRRIECQGYVYARNNTVVYEFDLGCKEWLRALAGTLSHAGVLLVLPITGYISDNYGRRVAFVLSIFNMSVFGLIRAFSVNYTMYLVLQFLQSTFGAGIYSAGYIFATELVGPKYRVIASAICAAVYSTGEVLLAGIAWLVQPWRYLILTLYIPCFLLLGIYWFIPESARWLLSKGKYEEATKVLKKVARTNRRNISQISLHKLTRAPPALVGDEEQVLGIMKTIVNSPILLRRVLTTPIWWITTTFVYYGLSINSVGLSDTMYLNYMLTCAVEIPSAFISVLILDKIGRKITLSGSYFLSASCNIAFLFIPRDLEILRLTIYLLGKFGISLVFTCLYLYTSELYPTRYRHSLVAFSSMIGRIGSIIAPLTPALAEYWYGIPSVMFGAMGLFSGLLVLTQPETLGTKLPDTLAEAEALGRPEPKNQAL